MLEVVFFVHYLYAWTSISFTEMNDEGNTGKILRELRRRQFIGPGKYKNLYLLLDEYAMSAAAESLKKKADLLFGPENW